MNRKKDIIRLKRSVSILDDILYVGFMQRTIKRFSLYNYSLFEIAVIKEMLQSLKNNISEEEVLKTIKTKLIRNIPNDVTIKDSANIEGSFENSCARILEVLEFLDINGALERNSEAEEDQDYSTWKYCEAVHNLPLNEIKEITNKKVAIVGCGAIGSNTAIALARMGIKRFLLIDIDIVEKGNISRQTYTHKECKMSKGNALKMQLKAIEPKIHVNIEFNRISSANIDEIFMNLSKAKVDFICWSIDTPVDIDKDAIRANIPFELPIIFGGFKEYMGYVGPCFDTDDFKNWLLWNKAKDPIEKYVNRVDPLSEKKPTFYHSHKECKQVSYYPLVMQVSGYIADTIFTYLLNGKNKLKGVMYAINSIYNTKTNIKL
ncbi:MAG: ThiF family adenylyltransferase [Clostridium sp.]